MINVSFTTYVAHTSQLYKMINQKQFEINFNTASQLVQSHKIKKKFKDQSL